VRGAVYYLLAGLLGTLIGIGWVLCFKLSQYDLHRLFHEYDSWKHLIRFPWVVVPPLAWIGAWANFETFRLAVGVRPWLTLRKIVVGLCCCAAAGMLLGIFSQHLSYEVRRYLRPLAGGPLYCILLLIPISLQSLPRLRLSEREGPGIAPIGCFALAYVVGGFLLLAVPFHIPALSDQVVWCMSVGVYVAISLADTILVRQVARWRDEGRLDQATGRRFQFSLQTLMLFVFSFGAWLTGVLFFFGL